MAHPSDPGCCDNLMLDFERRVRKESRGWRLSSDGGPFIVRELGGDIFVPFDRVSALRADSRTAANRIHPIAGLFRQALYRLFAGYEDAKSAGLASLAKAFGNNFDGGLFSRFVEEIPDMMAPTNSGGARRTEGQGVTDRALLAGSGSTVIAPSLLTRDVAPDGADSEPHDTGDVVLRHSTVKADLDRRQGCK